MPDPMDIPTPEEITRVTTYLQEQVAVAQETLLAAKRAQAEAQDAGTSDLIINGKVSGLDFERRPWDASNIPWQKRGDITGIRLDFTDGTQATVGVNKDGDGLEVSIVMPPTPPSPPPEPIATP